jgi:hypothetical protein
MPKLSKHSAFLNFEPGNPAGYTVNPISVSVTIDETWAPYVQATVTVPTNLLPEGLDPRTPTFVALRLQQDFGDVIWCYEITAGPGTASQFEPAEDGWGGIVSNITAEYEGNISKITRAYSVPWNIFEQALPISTITAAYGGDVSDITAAGLIEIWKISDFLHQEGTFNPAPSTVFDSWLMLRTLNKDYISKESTLSLESYEVTLQDVIGGASLTPVGTFYSLRDIINYVLAGKLDEQLEPGDADYAYPSGYPLIWTAEKSGWDIISTLATAAGLVFYSDELGRFYLIEPGATAGELYLKDDDNITALTTTIDRNNPFFFETGILEYRNEGIAPVWNSYYGSVAAIQKERYFLIENVVFPGGSPAEPLVNRALTRGELNQVEAISNYNARPRQTMEIDITGEAIKTAIIQSITWSLPSGRMSVDIRDLQEVI